MTTTAVLIRQVCDDVKEMLLSKNAAYGDSALDPVRIFSRSSPIEQINVRIDDKLSRLSRGSTDGEDTEKDLIGYLILKEVFRRKQALRDGVEHPPEYTDFTPARIEALKRSLDQAYVAETSQN